jgi:hypothetical protein
LAAIPEDASQSRDRLISKSTNNDFIDLLNQREFSDVTLMAEGKPIYAH